MKELTLSDTPSIGYNNLVVDSKTDVMAYVSNGQIVAKPLKEFITNGKVDDNTVIQNLSDYEVKNVALCMDGKCIAATCEKGVLFYEAKSFSLLYFYKIDGEITFTFTALAGSGTKLYAGDTKGNLSVFTLNSQDSIMLESCKNISLFEITSVVFNGDHVCVGTANGDVLIMNSKCETIKCHKNKVEALEYPCSSLNIVGNVLISAFASGHVRIYDLVSGNKTAELGAHSKSVTALASKSKGGEIVFVTVSEDCSVFVWSYNNKISAVKGDRIKDSMIVGVQFVDENRLMLTCFEKKDCFLMDL
ncbi:WD40 repeat domain-containing protein [Naegleria gruberi]|uniref:WD40 repeat domain-containing protein n=1 Tax=Naegleria gruberi TaxID=5762 RepID=D2UYN4_NAEGR|nr:WD40 repeat domain-containing protein [Naegleria gruberi]EFC50506.1 WD40 repeat domain-containing protein [Naegleria gruberi]|eukprot:XP_002683250.1 WD40 repeat domain-containing protein [Naegleria gruberi strain NEG-M]